ncbi:hypothetical protein LCGC14_2029790 [marine sediment metagenome]|uniref:Uncharacterized protein n=1 Tax=marine sediment metagenome TaxID=412755 RepID=A0A0F9FHK7_9ZZZZ
MGTNYTVKINFDDGSNDYDFLLVQSENGSNLTGRKDTIIEGNRGDGAILIPGGKRAQTITVRGILAEDDYVAITALMNTMKSNITTDIATLTMKHDDGGEVIDWQYTVRRIGEIRFPENMRTSSQEYEVDFLVLQY